MKSVQFDIRFKITSSTRRFLLISGIFVCASNSISQILIPSQPAQVKLGAEQTEAYLPILKGKKVAVVANQTSVIGKTHLVDSLLSLNIKVKKIFAPEHGFRGDAANGEKVSNGIDKVTGLPIVSLYGKNIRPSKKDLKGIDVVVFDIQDVGVRFYTYLTTLHYVMQSCAEFNCEILILDRPNPNGYYIDGPILKKGFESMVGLHPIPLVHGMTLGELAKMINGEHWIGEKSAKLTVIPIQNYTHNTPYILPVPPSPNLPSTSSIILYPTLGLFEGTQMSMGRGTEKPFECFGAPWISHGKFSFTPQDIPGKAMNPPYKGQLCHGFLVTDFALDYLTTNRTIYIEWLIALYKECPDKTVFFNSFFDKLAGSEDLRQAIIQGKSAAEIRKSWEFEISRFTILRKPYLLYDFDPNIGFHYPKTH